MIEAGDERKAARAREPAIGRLQAEDAAQRRRHANGAVGVGAERERRQAAGHRPAGAAGGTAGHTRHVVRIARGTVVHVLAGEVVGVFAHVERADQHRAGGFQARDQRRVFLRRRIGAVDLGAGDGNDAFDVEQVLHRERHAGKRQLSFIGRGVDRGGAGAGALGGHRGEGVERRIARGDARQRLLDDLGGAHLARRHGLRDLRGTGPGRVGGHRLRPRTPAPARPRPAAEIHRPARHI